MRGSVIVPVLIIIVLLAFVAAETGKSLTTDHGGAAYLRGALAAAWPMDDAEHLAIRTLAADYVATPDVDHFYDVWTDYSKDLGALSASGSARLEGGIVDMEGLFPINRLHSKLEPKSAQRKQYEAVFLRLLQGVQDAYDVSGDPRKFVDSLRYWMGDPIAPRNDSKVYEGREPPYERPKRLLAYPQELALVYWEGVEQADVRKVMLGEGGNPGLANFITTWGTGKINMNTAPEPIVRAVCPDLGKTDPYWQAVKAYRAGEGNDFGKTWYLDLATSLKIAKNDMPSHCLGLSSSAFALDVECFMGGVVRRHYAVMLRGTKGEVKTVFRQSY